MDTLDGMRVLSKVVEEGSFSGAARKLGISTALASKYIGQLEDRLGARLLTRTTRKVNPTDLGRAYYDRCTGILEQVDELEDAVQQQTSSPRGHLRIAGPRVFGEEVLARCIEYFIASYPDITVDLVLEERVIDLVTEGFDLAVRIGALPDSAMIARRISSYRYVLCASPEYLNEKGHPQHPKELTAHTCIINSNISPTNQWQFLDGGKRISVTVSPLIRVNSGRPIHNMVLSGRGIGLCLLPSVEQDIENGRLVRVLQEYEAYDRDINVIYPHARHLTAKVRAFVDFAADYFRKL